MARFSAFYQPNKRCGGRPLDPNSKAGQKRAEIARKEQEREAMAFADFENSESGYFNGFSFVNAFHENYRKSDALEVLIADDCADVVTNVGAKIHAGADGVTVYIMTERAQNGDDKKYVIFNRSIYVF